MSLPKEWGVEITPIPEGEGQGWGIIPNLYILLTAPTYLNCSSRFGFSRSSQSASTATDSFW